jgi:two-component system cell cycle response regulator
LELRSANTHPPRTTGEDYILIVEDEMNSRYLLNTYLTHDGYKVKEARTGEDALKTISEAIPSVIVLDVLLPGITGFEVCRRLKHSISTSFIPIILVTALRGDKERIQGIEAGADDFISKPFNRVELITRIKSLLRIKGLHDALEQKIDELEKAKDKLRKLAVTDGMTGVYNYRAFKSQLGLEISRSKRFGLPVSLLMIDIDHFKHYNDRYGHLNGDLVLRTFARLLKENIRDVDCLARYGGEEFVIILPGTDKHSASLASEKIRKLIAATIFPPKEQMRTGSVTISIGVAAYPEDAKDENELVSQSDKALYKAKAGGRNRTELI